ncbi:MAG: type VI secretion system tip protein VgrG [Polyangiaceae bacterium]|nr:type VI secretion system tip protein VgrG [Polyangiaceae bacterium]
MPTLDFTCSIGSPFDIRRFRVRESISQLFTVEFFAIAEEHNIDLESVVGQPASLRVDSGYQSVANTKRGWSGVVSSIEQVQAMEAGRHGTRVRSTYFVRMVPTLSLMQRRINHRIHQRLSIPDIIDKLLAEWDIQPVWKIEREKYPKLEYKSQYGESDYAYFSRLLEEAGIAYVLADVEEETRLILADELTLKPLREGPTVPYEDEPTESAQRPFVTKVRIQHDVRPGAQQIIDFDFRNPGFRLLGDAPKAAAPENKYEQYEYRPGAMLVEAKGAASNTPTADDKGAYRYDGDYGNTRAARSLDAKRGGKRAVEFESNVVELAPGVVFQMEGHPHDSLAEPLLVTAFEINGTHDGRWEMNVSAHYRGDTYRPPVETKKPKVFGVQSATVVGPKGQEIHVDEFGRVRVQFPWDREGTFDDNSSCWIRVSQGWAGTGFGMINIPRIGQEVLIGFLDGDPDAPILVGRAFNQLNPVPYKLPENKTVSGWKTHSSPANGGYNEIKLEDKANKELVYVQAQKDLHKLVKRDWTERIGRHHHRTIAQDQHLVVQQKKYELVHEDDHLHVKGDRMQLVDGSTSLTVGVDQDIKVGNKHAVDAGTEIHLKAGTKVVLDAGQTLTIKGAGGFITLHPGGIDIVGTLVRINSGGSAASGSGAEPTKPADAEEAQPKDSSDQIQD